MASGPISSVNFLSHVWLSATPWTAAHQASLSITNSQSLLRLMSTESVMPSNYRVFCCPLLLPPSIFHSIGVFLLLLLLLSHFSHVQLCVTPQMAAHQAPPSLGFSRQEHWSWLPFPSPMHESERWKWSRSFVSNSSWPHGLQPTRLLHPCDSPGKSTGVGCHCLLRQGLFTSWQIDGETMETVRDFIFLCSKITVDGDCSHEIKRHLLIGRKAMTNLDSILKSRDITLPTKVHLVKALVSNSHVWIWELDYKESWALKNWCFWTVVLEKTLESPLDCKEIQPVHPKENQSWLFIGKIDAKAETPILWPPDLKYWLIWKDLDAGKDWRQEEQGVTEDELVEWHHWLNGHEFEYTLEVGDGWGGLACSSPWGCKELDMTEWLNQIVHIKTACATVWPWAVTIFF